MPATAWEFRNRAALFSVIFGGAFGLYTVDYQNAAVVLANWLAPRLPGDADGIARFLFAAAALLLGLGALIRTWASAYLHAGVVYASELKTDWLIAEVPTAICVIRCIWATSLCALGWAR